MAAPIPVVGTASVGLDTTSLGLTANEIPAVKRGLLNHDQQSSPYMSWLQSTPGRLLIQPQEDYYWNEIQIDRPSYVTDGSGIPGGSTTATVTIAYPAILNGQLLSEQTSGQFFIVNSTDYATTPGSTVCVVQVPDGSTTITAVTGAVQLVDCSTGMIEGGDFLQARSYDPARFTNTVMKSSHSIKATTEKVLSQRYWGWPWDLDKLAEFSRQKQGINRSMFLSQYVVNPAYTQITPTATTTGVLRTTRGTLPSIQTNIAAGPPSGTVSKAVWYDYLNNYVWPNQFAGKLTKLCLVGKDTNADIQMWMTDLYRTTVTGSQMFGVNLVGFIFGNKRLIMMEEPAFTQIQGLTHGAVTLDMDHVFMTQYGPNLFELKDTTPPSSDTHSLSSTSMYGNETEFEYSHSVLMNFN